MRFSRLRRPFASSGPLLVAVAVLALLVGAGAGGVTATLLVGSGQTSVAGPPGQDGAPGADGPVGSVG